MTQKGSPSPLWRPAGTVGCLCLRVLQLVLAVVALAIIASSTGELTSDLRLWYLAPVRLYFFCEILLIFLNFVFIDQIMTAAVFTAASEFDHAEWPHGARYRTVVALAFVSFLALHTSFLINLANLAGRIGNV